VNGGIVREDEKLGRKCRQLLKTIPDTNTLVHGDFHTQNVFLLKDEPLLIDMDRVSMGHPIIEISDLYYFYVILGEEEPEVVEKFMGFSYELAREFFSLFLKYYLETEDEAVLKDVSDKAALICYTRMIRKIRKKTAHDDADRAKIKRYLEKLRNLTNRLTTLAF
jgi:thiamine kinase-like enzyme